MFQLADHWTLGVEVEEYVAFLERGYEAVFKELQEQDKPDLPKKWKKHIKKVKSIKVPPANFTVNLMATILHDMIKAVKAARDHGNPAPSLDSFTVDFFARKYGTGTDGKAAKKHLKSFTSGLLHLIGDDKSVFQDFALLFARIGEWANRSIDRQSAILLLYNQQPTN